MRTSVIYHNMPNGKKDLSINVQGMTCEESDAISRMTGVISANTVEAYSGARLTHDQKTAINRLLIAIWAKLPSQATE